jgi:hypothetical protein
MIFPFISECLFDINPNFKLNFIDGVIIIDDWYLNYEGIYNVLINMPVARWKSNINSKNFIDYYDCRPIFPIHEHKISVQGSELIKSFITDLYKTNKVIERVNPTEFNYYKNIKLDIDSNMQHFPHIDYEYNAIVYLDKICSGGTAIYDLAHIKNTESFNLLYNVSNIPKKIIQAFPNRLVIFEGKKMHGGYIENHNKYTKDWRINQIMFFDEYE